MSKNKRYRNKPSQLTLKSDYRSEDLPYTNDPAITSITATTYWNRPEATTNETFDGIKTNEEITANTGSNTSWADFASNVIQGKITIRISFIFLLATMSWFILVGWLTIQDNNAGFLQTNDGLQRLGFKVLLTLMYYVVFSVILLLFWLTSKPWKKK